MCSLELVSLSSTRSTRRHDRMTHSFRSTMMTNDDEKQKNKNKNESSATLACCFCCCCLLSSCMEIIDAVFCLCVCVCVCVCAYVPLMYIFTRQREATSIYIIYMIYGSFVHTRSTSLQMQMQICV